MTSATIADVRDRVDIEIGPMDLSETRDVVAMLARGMRDNPLHIVAFSEDPQRRRKIIERTFTIAAERFHWDRHMIVARTTDGAIVGVCGMSPPGACQPPPMDRLKMIPAMLGLGPRVALRVMRWLGGWSRVDPTERHWHLGPLGVDAHLQGQGIGSSLMRVFTAQMDAAGENAYLETDKAINVEFYKRFGFETIAEQAVLGVPNYFMLRRPEPTR